MLPWGRTLQFPPPLPPPLIYYNDAEYLKGRRESRVKLWDGIKVLTRPLFILEPSLVYYIVYLLLVKITMNRKKIRTI